MDTKLQVAYFADGFNHKHYEGAAKQYEVLEELEGHGKGFFIKVFFINDKVNLNKWQVTWDGIKQDIADVVGVPIVLQEDLRHPNFAIQNLYAKGYIIDYTLDEVRHEASVIARILDPKTITLIQEGKLKFVSPAVVARNNLSITETKDGVDLLSRFIALHLALVANPAYGKQAKIHGTCTGTGQTCSAKLQTLTAEMVNDLKTAPLTQTPLLLKKLQASLNRLDSEFHQLERKASQPEFNGKWGYWIKAKDMDVFVAIDQTVDVAIKNQCQCEKI